MKRFLLLGWVSVFCSLLQAQNDPVLMRINGKDVSRSEFEYSYRRFIATGKKVTAKEYAEIFTNRKLKVESAKALGLDTLSSFRKHQETYRATLLKSYLTDERITDSCARAYYYGMKAHGRTGQVQVMQIFRRLPQTITPRRLELEKTRMDSIYQAIKEQPEADFQGVVTNFSDDKQSVWIEPLQVTSEFEDIAFSLKKDEISKPFFTPAGIHILKVIDRREMPAYEALSDKLSERVRRGWGMDKGAESAVERLKKQLGYTSNSSGVEELLNKGDTEQTLFTIDGKAYSGSMFKRFASSYPQAVKRQLNAFIAKSVLDYESKNVESKHPDIYNTFREFEENELVANLTYQKIDLPVKNDRAALATYFKFHQADYNWKTPRYRGVVLHCADKKTGKRAKKMLKKLPEKEWVETLRKTFNTTDEETIKIEQGIFADGDNKYIDKLVFKKGDFEPVMSYPFTVVVGEKMKGPGDYREVIDQVRKDYQNYLDACWTRELRTSGKVEINQEVLKTVNND